MGRVTFWLIEEAPLQPGCNGKPCVTKIFKANQIAWFFCNGQHQNQHHDWNLLNKFWLLVTFEVPSKVSLKVKLISFKIQNIIFHQYADMSDRNVNPKSHICQIYMFLIHFLLLILIYILFKLQIPDKKKSAKWLFSFFFTYLKIRILTGVSLLIIYLFEKHNRLFSYFIFSFKTKN